MDSSVASWVINGLLGVVMFFMKMTLSDLKDQLKEHKEEINVVKETTTKKEDFQEFKQELWRRLDGMKTDFQRALDKQ